MRSLPLRYSIRSQWHRTQTCALSIEDGIGYSRSQPDNRRFTRAIGRHVFAVNNLNLNRGKVAEARHAIRREVRIEHTSVREVHILEQCSTNCLNNGALDLAPQAIRIYHRPTVPGLQNARDS